MTSFLRALFLAAPLLFWCGHRAHAGQKPPVREGFVRRRARVMLAKATRLRKEGRLQAARAAAVASLSVDPTFREAYLVLGQILEELGLPARALWVYRKGTEKAHPFPEGLRRAARLAHSLGQDRAATESLQAADGLEGKGPLSSWNTMLTWSAERKAWPEALRWARRIAAYHRKRRAWEKLRQARIQVRALVILAGELAPTRQWDGGASPGRRRIAASAERLGL